MSHRGQIGSTLGQQSGTDAKTCKAAREQWVTGTTLGMIRRILRKTIPAKATIVRHTPGLAAAESVGATDSDGRRKTAVLSGPAAVAAAGGVAVVDVTGELGKQKSQPYSARNCQPFHQGTFEVRIIRMGASVLVTCAIHPVLANQTASLRSQ